MKPGPKSKYKKEYCQRIQEIASQGGHISAMRAAIGGIAKETWYSWQEEYPEFKEAVEQAKLLSEVFYEKVGLDGMLGKIPKFQPKTYEFVMQNKFSDDYRKTPNTEVNIVNNTLNLTSEEIQTKIEQKLEKLRSLGKLT